MFEREKWYNLLPPSTYECWLPYLELFFQTMYERQMIWKRRFLDKRPRPWTTDPILDQYKFTNVYRELDRSSQWQIKNILLDHDLDITNLVWKLMVYRIFNSPETFSFDSEKYFHLFSEDQAPALSANRWRNGIPDYDKYDEEEFADFIAGVRRAGLNPYTNAYLINSMATPGHGRDYCYTHVVLPTLHGLIPQLIDKVHNAENPKEIIAFLKTIPEVSDFIAHEFYQDFTYIPRYTDKTFMKFDQNDFTNVGPGASVGIRLIFPSLTRSQQVTGIYKLRDMAEQKLSRIGEKNREPMPYLEWDKKRKRYKTTEECNITLHQIEMWLCEFQKYWKMTTGQGKQRSKFSPKTIVK